MFYKNSPIASITILFICSQLTYCQKSKPIPINDSFKARSEMVFIDNADKGEYVLSVSIQEGVIKKNSYIKATDGKSHTYHFQVTELKVNDQSVTSAKAGEDAFMVMVTSMKASFFDSGFTLTPSSEEEYLIAAKSSSPSSEKEFSATKDIVKVDFNLNGQKANVTPKSQDDDPPSAMLNQQNKKLTIMMYGDEKSQPRRGMVTIEVENFSVEKGKVKNTVFSFVRYKDLAGNMLAEWTTKKGKIGELVITEIKPVGDDGYGENYSISGTFEANMGIKMGYESETKVKAIDITKGTFSNIHVKALFYKKKGS